MNFKQLLPIYLAAIIGPMGGIGIITLLPVLAKIWETNLQWISLTITFYMIPYVIFQLFSGSIAQVFNTRKTLLFGFGVYIFGAFLCGISPNLKFLMGARFIQGLGAAFITPIVMALVGEMVTPKHVGKAMGILGVAYTIGVTMGPLVSGLLEMYFGWAWFFFFLMALAMGIGSLYWVTSAKAVEQKTGSGRIWDTLALVKQSFSYPDVRYLSFSVFSLFIGYIGMMTFMADYLKTSYSLSSDKIGFVLSMTGVLGVVAAPIAGMLGDRFGRRRIVYAGEMIMIGSILGFGYVEYSYGMYIVLFALFGAGSSTAWISMNTLAVQVVPELRKPVTSLYNTFKFTGYGLAPLMLSFLYLPFSITGVRWACLASVLISLMITSRVRSKLG